MLQSFSLLNLFDCIYIPLKMKYTKVIAQFIILPAISTLAMSSAPNDVHTQPTAGISASPEPSELSNTTPYNYGITVEVSDSTTHYSVSYSNTLVSITAGVGHDEPMPTSIPNATKDKCNGTLLGLLSGLGIDLGISLDLSILGINVCLGI